MDDEILQRADHFIGIHLLLHVCRDIHEKQDESPWCDVYSCGVAILPQPFYMGACVGHDDIFSCIDCVRTRTRGQTVVSCCWTDRCKFVGHAEYRTAPQSVDAHFYLSCCFVYYLSKGGMVLFCCAVWRVFVLVCL